MNKNIKFVLCLIMVNVWLAMGSIPVFAGPG